jgi:hypothetical protein
MNMRTVILVSLCLMTIFSLQACTTTTANNLVLTGKITLEDPEDIRRDFTNKTNITLWHKGDPGTWLCVSSEYAPVLFPTNEYDFTLTFIHTEGMWTRSDGTPNIMVNFDARIPWDAKPTRQYK